MATDLDFKSRLRKMPKIELHAHLNGSVRLSYLEGLVDKDLIPSQPPPDATPEQYFRFMADVSHLTARPEVLRSVIHKILKDFEEDGVMYLELRSSPKQTEHISKTEYIDIIIECMSRYPGLLVPRYLISVDLSKSAEEMRENADLAVKYTASSTYVSGVDLCGNYLSGASRANCIEVLSHCKAQGLKVACHIAEDTVIADLTADLLRVIQPDRLGHATLIDPSSLDGRYILDNQMLVECCMTSNILCKTVPSYSQHHFKKWWDLGHPALLCTDDSGTFDTNLTDEYHRAVDAFGLSFEDLLSMNRKAVEWIFDETMKERLRKLFTISSIC